MKIRTSIHAGEFPAAFARFQELIPSRPWLRRATKIAEEIRGNRFLSDYLRHENRVLFALEAMSKQHAALLGQVTSPAQYETVALVTQVVDLHGLLDAARQKALVGRVTGSFQNIDDLRALQFELMVANHFAKRGYDLDMPEARQTGNFDLHATKDTTSVEIECKSIAQDKGQGVRLREALEFFHLAKREMEKTIRRLNRGLLMRMILPGRLPGAFKERKALSGQLHTALISGQSMKSDLCEIVPTYFDLAGTPFVDREPNQEKLRSFVEDKFPVQQPQVVCMVQPGVFGFVLALENARVKPLLESVFGIMSEAAHRQLTGHAPGILCVKFEGVTPAQMAELGAEQGPPSPLRIATTAFLNSGARSHVAGVAFMSGGEVLYRDGVAITQEGVSYCFDNNSGRFGRVPAFRDLVGD